MKKHIWYQPGRLELGLPKVCCGCGVPKVAPAMELPCPPWKPASTEPKVALELKELRDILSLVTAAGVELLPQAVTEGYRLLGLAEFHLERLIAKLEAR